MLCPPIEGHHVASRRIIEAATSAGIAASVATVELDSSIGKIPRNWHAADLRGKFNLQIPLLQPAFSVFYELLMSLRIAEEVKFSDCDLVHVLNMNKEAYLLAHKLVRERKPLFLHFYHSPYVLGDDVFLLRSLALRLGLYGRNLGNYVLTVNASMAKFLVERTGADPQRVQVVPYPIDTHRFKPMSCKQRLREKYGLPPDSSIIAYVGSLHPARGLSVLMRSLSIILSRFPKLLLLVSHPNHKSEEGYKQYLYNQILNLGFQKNMLILGPSAEVEEIYNLADVIVLPFQRPYWVDPPLVLLEAMSCGAAVVTTLVGATAELLKSNENAVVVEPGNHEVLAESVMRTIENPDMSIKIARKARETIIKDYSYEVVGRKMLGLYELALSLC